MQLRGLRPFDAVRGLAVGPGSGSSRARRNESRDDDLLGENVGIGEVVGFIEAFVSEPEDIEAGFVAVAKQIKN